MYTVYIYIFIYRIVFDIGPIHQAVSEQQFNIVQPTFGSHRISWNVSMKYVHFPEKNLLFASYNTCSVILYEARIKVSSLVIAISHELPPWITPNILLHIIHFRIILQYVWWLEKLNIGILPKFSTRWGPQHSIQLPSKWLNSMVYGRYNDN